MPGMVHVPRCSLVALLFRTDQSSRRSCRKKLSFPISEIGRGKIPLTRRKHTQTADEETGQTGENNDVVMPMPKSNRQQYHINTRLPSRIGSTITIVTVSVLFDPYGKG
eukprot:scaffold1953_cov176-Amphora_coffeaeformis.AAC.30